MINQGLSVRATAAALGISHTTVQRVRDTMKEDQTLTNGLMSPELDGLSAEVLHNFMRQGAKMKKVRGSDALGAVKVYADRRWPTKQDQAPQSISFTQINIGQYAPQNPPTEEIEVNPAPDMGHNGTKDSGFTDTIDKQGE
jgi:hypothetical protein